MTPITPITPCPRPCPTRGESLNIALELPKFELHLHLDGSLSPEFIAAQAKLMNMPLPVAAEDLRTWLLMEKTKMPNHFAMDKGKNWSVFDFCNKFLQTEEQLEGAVKDLLSRLQKVNVVYAEIRFCPQLHTDKGLTLDQVVEAALKGFSSQSAVKGGLIVGMLRSMDARHGIAMAELAIRQQGQGRDAPPGVVALDICGDEGSYPARCDTDPMIAGLKLGAAAGLPLALHAGEWPDGVFSTIENIRYAVDKLGARRIGHGLALEFHEDVRKAVREKRVVVEVCLTANIAWGRKVTSYAQHPAKVLFREGVQFSLSSDNLLLSGDLDHRPHSVEEIDHLANDVFEDPREGWAAVRASLQSGMDGALSPNADEEWKKDIARKIDEVYTKYKLTDIQ